VKNFHAGKKYFVVAGQNLFWSKKVLSPSDETFSDQTRSFSGESGPYGPIKIVFLRNGFRLARTWPFRAGRILFSPQQVTLAADKSLAIEVVFLDDMHDTAENV
jgi:hypothetical protein